MIVEVFIAQRKAKGSLCHQGVNAVLDAARVTIIGEAARHPVQQADALINFSQQQPTAVGSDPAAVETAHHLSST
jgi:hypothetical protein